MVESLISLVLVTVVTLIVVIAGIKKSAVGELVAFVFVIAVTWWRTGSLASLGFTRPVSWLQTILVGIVIGAVLALASTVLFEPLAEKITGEVHDFSAYDSLRGNFSLLLKWMPIVWIWVALIEEVIFRGFVLKELIQFFGGGTAGIIIGLVVSSIVFGLPHLYQGKSGVISTCIVGFLLGVVFVWANYNLWLLIIVHGITDTVGLAMIYAGADRYLKKKLSI
jgi:membrane protease YdiL (CAAX protease family)